MMLRISERIAAAASFCQSESAAAAAAAAAAVPQSTQVADVRQGDHHRRLAIPTVANRPVG